MSHDPQRTAGANNTPSLGVVHNEATAGEHELELKMDEENTVHSLYKSDARDVLIQSSTVSWMNSQNSYQTVGTSKLWN